jgi:hypothetical protein
MPRDALNLRKVDHPQASNNYRVILKVDETEHEIGSIGRHVPHPHRRGLDLGN